MPSENLAGRTIAGYRLLERVGEGGTATVYRAEHPDRGAAAVKVLKERLRTDPTAIKRFLREAGYGTRVVHPHVVRTFDYGLEEGLHYLALEWAKGEPLSTFVGRCGPLAPQLVAHIVGQLAEALAAAHRVGIIHRDLKPENIMYDPATQQAKLLDFGIARDAQQDAAERLTRTGFFVGTLQYVAPEALSGELVREPADIYSLATITYHLLTGDYPFRGRTQRELFQQLLRADPVPINSPESQVSVSAALEQAIMIGLSRNPAKRQASVTAFAEEVAKAVERSAAPPQGPASRESFSGLRALWDRISGQKKAE
ncbi:MAG: serine/threonine protein kinase [Gemmatimonadetes bacterium]|nr:serine/threonine protein kinase [Gemmatimonadota bacterium]